MSRRAVAENEDTVGNAGEVGVADADAAFAALFRDEFESIFRTIYRIVSEKEVARDVTQEAFACVRTLEARLHP